MLGQFSNLLTTEYSPEMTDKNQCCSMIAPDGAEFDTFFVFIDHGSAAEFVQNGWIKVHVNHPFSMFGV
jgi:hypothetical protein